METLTYRSPRLVVLIVLTMVAAGVAAFLSLGRQEDPSITNLFATVTTQFPGADPARVEALVTAEIEEEVRTIAEVDLVTSVSRTGVSVVSVELIQTLGETEIEQTWTDVRAAVARAQTSFPADVLAPEIDSEGISAYSAVISVTPTHDDVAPALISRHAEVLADRLRNIPSTRAVDLFGLPEEEVLISVDPMRAAALGLSATEISQLITAADGKVQAGRLQDNADLSITVSGEIEAIDRLRGIVLRENADGVTVTLADVAEISRGIRTPQSEMAFANGKPAVLVGVLAQDGVQIDVWMERVRTSLTEGTASVPFGLQETLLFDQSTYTVERLQSVALNMAIGIGLVVAVLLVTLGLRAAIIVALVLPVVSLATLATLNFMGIPLHQMSVTGLIVALGLLVDAAIVMCDEVRKRLAQGMDRENAAGDAVRRLAGPLLASTVTTALAFTPMILLPGPAGDFVGSIAISVVVMLIWSLIVALTVTPALAAWFIKAVPAREGSGLFERFMGLVLRNPLRSLAISLILPVLGFMSMSTLTAQFFPGVDRDQFYLEADMPAGTSISETREAVLQMDSSLRADSGVESVYWTVGTSGPAFYYNITGGRSQEPAFAQAMITTTTDADAARLVEALQEEFGAAYPQAQIVVRGIVQGPPVAAPVELRIEGQDPAELRRLGDKLRAIMVANELVTSVRTGTNGGAPQVRFEIDEVQARLLGLNVTDVANQLNAALVGVTGGSLVEGTEQLPVRVRMGDGLRSDLAAISDMSILLPGAASLSAQGTYPAVPLSALATPVLEPAEGTIIRRGGQRENTVQAFLVPNVLPEEALTEIGAVLDEQGFELPEGYQLKIGGDADARDDTVGSLMASVGLIVTLTIGTIALTFNSFRLTAVTLVVCGLSAGLSILSLAIMQYPFGIVAIIGVIGSIGVSINAAIIILTGLQADPASNAGDRGAMAKVVAGSSRHIISTTVTTFGGFLPLILDGGAFWPPFAVSIAGGVLLSTVVSFLFTPAAFALIHRKVPMQSEEDAETAPADSPLPFPLAAE
ncbi:MAG: efflux RND transporter permease subunit [Rhodobacteraceae bacterium]|nr:efflux RND transporter permease subunit [Paracoccaceae bacterium]